MDGDLSFILKLHNISLHQLVFSSPVKSGFFLQNEATGNCNWSKLIQLFRDCKLSFSLFFGPVNWTCEHYHQLLYDVILMELIVIIPRFLCSLHPYANMHFNPTPIQSFLMPSGTDPFASIIEWVQSEGQTVQHQCEECGLQLKQKTEWMVVPEMLSFEKNCLECSNDY